MQMRTQFLALAIFVFLSNIAHAEEFYTIEDQNQQSEPTTEYFGSSDLISMQRFSLRTMTDQMRELAVNLLSWTLHSRGDNPATDPYNRKLHFGRWINDPTDETCYNTRAKVLLRDTNGDIFYRQTNRCVVDRGTWSDPYTGRTFTDSRDIQIDHMVPLKNAYVSGAWKWDYQTRCLYANFLGNNFHLISSNGIENMRKGDRAPNGYMPPNLSYQCRYLENWLKIKLIWKLTMTPAEVSAIRDVVQKFHCDTDEFELSEKELRQQRTSIRANMGLCPAR